MKKMFNCAFSAVRSLVASSSDRRGGGRAPGVRRLGVESLEARELLSVSNFQSSPIAMAPETPEFICTTAPPEENILVSCSALIDDQTDQFDDVCNASPWDAFESDSCETGLESLARIRATAPEYGPPTFEQHLAFALLDSDEEPLDDGGDGDACGDGCDYGCEAKIRNVRLASGDDEVANCMDGYAEPDGTELLIMQSNEGTATLVANMAADDVGYQMDIQIRNPGAYWSVQNIDVGVKRFQWTKPSNESNSIAQRDFSVDFYLYTDSNGNGKYDSGEPVVDSTTLSVHIGYAELQASIAGGEFAPVASQNNEVVVGQSIKTRLVLDSRFTVEQGVVPQWDFPAPNSGVIKSYMTSEQTGTVAFLTADDLRTQTLSFYDVTQESVSVGATISAQWLPAGAAAPQYKQIYNSCSFTVKAPASSSSMTEVNGTGLGLNNNNGTSLVSPVIEFNSAVDPVTRNGAVVSGEVNYLQTVVDRSYALNSQEEKIFRSVAHSQALDAPLLYGERPSKNYASSSGTDSSSPSEWSLTAQRVNATTYASVTEDLVAQGAKDRHFIHMDMTHRMFLIYKPQGADSIWVPLSCNQWTLYAGCSYVHSTNQWILSDESDCAELNLPVFPPEWDELSTLNQNW